MYDTFTVTRFDRTTGRGHAEQTSSTQGFPPHSERFSFSTGVGNGICEYFLASNDSGIRIPSEKIAQRLPKVGTVIMGYIALGHNDRAIAIGEDGLPFLRNWFYKDQYDKAIAEYNEAHSDPNDIESKSGPDDDYDALEENEHPDDDYVTTDEVLARARRVISDPEMAAEAARMYPGDFI